MKMTYILIGLVITGGLLFYLTNRNSKRNSAMPNSGKMQTRDTLKNKKSIDNPYSELRQLAFNATTEQTRLTNSTDPDKVYGIIMDWDLGEEIATLVSFEVGEASMYLSTGGGIIGGGGHDKVKIAILDYISLGQTYLDKTNKTDTTPLPDKDCIKFYLLTSNGKFVAQEKMTNIENGSSKWLPLFEEGNKVISELRISTDKR